MMVMKQFGKAADEVVIEERLEGDEISIVMISDGCSIQTFPPAQDHQRVFDGNVGPNTGGMGCYAPTVLFSDANMHLINEEILQPTIDSMQKEGM